MFGTSSQGWIGRENSVTLHTMAQKGVQLHGAVGHMLRLKKGEGPNYTLGGAGFCSLGGGGGVCMCVCVYKFMCLWMYFCVVFVWVCSWSAQLSLQARYCSISNIVIVNLEKGGRATSMRFMAGLTAIELLCVCVCVCVCACVCACAHACCRSK